jgi:hypothetical protein
MAKIITRRVAILGGFAGAGLLIANTDKLTLESDFQRVFRAVEDWTKTAQRGLLFPERLAREYSPSDISPFFKPNGTYNPGTPKYNAHRWSGGKAAVIVSGRIETFAPPHPDHQA